MIRAAGILFRVRSTGACLFLQRGAGGDMAGTWVPPGGKLEGDETPEQAAVRESAEEAGPAAGKAARNLRLLSRRIAPVAPTPLDVPGGPATLAVRDDAVDFTTFLVDVDEPFDVVLDDENAAFAWAPAESPPEPLHPGARVALAKLSANELDVARMMAAGDLTSPQFFANVMLLDLRITGTGVAYRKAHDEYCYRAPENYLTEEFLARCSGLPVLWEHPAKATLDSKEWADRVVGTTFLPYVRGDEVWGIAKIYDQMAIDELTNGEDWSTSPTVDFGAGVVLKDVNTKGTVTLEDGSEARLLIEGEPPLLDHVAICPKGVWDKGGEPSGVNTARADTEMADEDDKKDDAARAAADKAKADAEDDKFKKIMDAIGGVSSLADSVAALNARMDSWEEKDKKSDAARKDEGEKEEKKANEAKDEPGAGDPKEVERKEADKKKDAAKKDTDEDEMADKKKDAKKDSDEDDKKSDAARADAAVAVNAALQRQIDELSRKITAQTRSDEDFNAIGAAQARADAVYQLWGRQAPRPYSEETTLAYKRRLANDLKAHSKTWKESDLSRVDAATFQAIESGIYADAATAARDPASFSEGELRQVRVPDAYGIGHRLEFHGRPSWWMDDFKSQPLKARFRRNGAAA